MYSWELPKVESREHREAGVVLYQFAPMYQNYRRL